MMMETSVDRNDCGVYDDERVASNLKNSPRGPGGKPLMNDDPEGGGGDNCGTPPLKMSTPRAAAATDNHSTDTKLSGDSGGTTSAVTISPRHKDPDRIKKDREREERVRQARERLEEERKKKLIELQEQQRQAQENREKQLELRRKKIEDLRRREMERRTEVEKRRREKETAEKSRRESLLLKAEERVARYEAWKRGGQKGPPPGSAAMPTAKHLSVSTSVLYHKRHSDFSSSSGALNVSNRPDSLLALNTIPEGRRSVLAPSNLSTSRPKSVMSLSTSSAGSASGGGVRLRENRSPRKPRPASVASSMPSFVISDTSKTSSMSSSPRSKSTDRLARERPRPRGAVSASRAGDKEEEEEEKKTSDKPGVKISRKTLDRLSTPRQVPSGDGDRKDSTSTPRREPNLVRTTPRKAYSTSNLAMPRQKSSLREKPTKDTPGKQTPKDTPIKPHKPKNTPKDKSAQQTTTPSAPSPVTVAPAGSSTPRAASPASRTPSGTPVRVLSPAPGADEDGGSGTPLARSTPTPAEKTTVETPQSSATPAPAETSAAEGSQSFSTPSAADKSTGDITAEEYKARLAEKRRQAREKAEREAEEERKRKEEEERLEEERKRQEEEEQKKREEEAVRLAEEARRAEEERLQKAIEAEEARRAEEAARLEQERLAKEEAERKAKEEADRLEQERQEKARREEEERLERKKRLEMIMKRVKTDNTGEGAKDSPRSVGGSPARSVPPVTSRDSSPLESDSKVAPTPSTQPAVAVEEEERKRSMDSSADESRSPASGAMSPANAPSPVPFAGQETTPMSQSSSQENMLDVREGSTPSSPRSASPIVSALLTPKGQGPASESSADKPKFKSPLLQKLVEGKEDTGSSPGEGPRFKSPLLQNILSKTRVGARMGLTQDYSRSSPDLSQVDQGTNNQASNTSSPTVMTMSTSMIDMDHDTNGPVGNTSSSTVMTMSSSMIDMNTVNSASKEELNRNEEKDVDTSEDTASSTHSSPSHLSRKTLVSNGETGGSAAPEVLTASDASLWNAQDSGVSLGSADLHSSTPSMSLNGHAPPAVATSQSQGLEDSSISMQSVDNTNPFLTDSAAESVAPPPIAPNQDHSSGDRNFEELIDLSVGNNSSSTVLNKSEELVSFNKLEEGSEGSPSLPPPPIIAFEETSMRKHQDVSDLLS